MSSIDTVFLSQYNSDSQYFSGNTRLLSIIKSIKKTKEFAQYVDNPTLDDLRSTDEYVVPYSGRYKAFMPLVTTYLTNNIEVPPGNGATTITFPFNSGNANLVGDMVIEVKIPAISISDLTPVTGAPILPVSGDAKIRYCDYPGIRLLERVELLANTKIVDQYSWVDVMEMMEHEMTNEKRRAFEMCMGQQQIKYAKSATTYDANGNPINNVQMWQPYTDGPQTPKNVQPALTLYIPLMFNWCRNPHAPLNNAFLDQSNRLLQITLAPFDKIVSHYIGYPAAILPSTYDGMKMRLFIRTMFADSRIAEVFLYQHKIMTRCWKNATFTTQVSGEYNKSMSVLKYPVELLYIRPIPSENAVPTLNTNAISTYDNYYLPALITRTYIPVTFMSYVPSTTTVFPNSTVYQTLTYDDVVSLANFTISQQSMTTTAYPPQFAQNYMSFVESSPLTRSTQPTSLLINFTNGWPGDLKPVANGYLDMSGVGNTGALLLTITTAKPITFYISTRYLNFYEPQPGKNIAIFHFTA